MRHMDENFDSTLTPAERAAPTFTEWSDATLARAVRAIANDLRDIKGFNGMVTTGAALALAMMMRDKNVTELDITIDGVTIAVRMPNNSMRVSE
jgi:hypothetical protein